jgi:hypothetical protein
MTTGTEGGVTGTETAIRTAIVTMDNTAELRSGIADTAWPAVIIGATACGLADSYAYIINSQRASCLFEKGHGTHCHAFRGSFNFR